MTLSPCPRCQNPAETIGMQIATCPFCAARSVLDSRTRDKILPTPTAIYPTWQSETEA